MTMGVEDGNDVYGDDNLKKPSTKYCYIASLVCLIVICVRQIGKKIRFGLPVVKKCSQPIPIVPFH